KYGTIANTRPPTVSGSGQTGEPLQATPGAWSVAGVSVKGQWLRNGAAISGQTSTTYTPVLDDWGHEIAYRETASKTGYKTATATSDPVSPHPPTPAVIQPPNRPATVRVGEPVTPTNGIWDPAVTPTWARWLLDDTEISGIVDGTTYTPQPSDVGRTLT